MKVSQMIDALSRTIDDARKDWESSESIAEGLSLRAREMDDAGAASFEEVDAACADFNAAKIRAGDRLDRLRKLESAQSLLQEAEDLLARSPLLL